MHVTKDLGLSYSTELCHAKEGGLVLPLRWGVGRKKKKEIKIVQMNKSLKKCFQV